MTDDDRDVVEQARRDIGRLELSTFVRLDRANALRAPQAVAALQLAERLDTVGRESGSSIAALYRTWLQTLAVALDQAVPAVEDEVDMARKARDEKRKRAGSRKT